MTQQHRKAIPKAIQTEILIASRRRCAMCLALEFNPSEVKGQIAHIDRNRSNNALANLAFVCLRHHAEYDTTSKQYKGYQPAELHTYKAALEQTIAEGRLPVSPPSRPRAHSSSAKSRRITLELFDRRVVIYRACRDYLHSIVREGKLPKDAIITLSIATDEALFLFDSDLAAYIRELVDRGLELRRAEIAVDVAHRRDKDASEALARLDKAFDAVDASLDGIRARFKPYLNL